MKKIKEQYQIPDQGIVLFSARGVIALSMGGVTEDNSVDGGGASESYTEENGTW